MKEYIDREAVLEAIKNHKCKSKVVYSIAEVVYCVGQEIGEAIRSVPAADVEEVVRCKDCAYGHETSGGLILCYFWQRGDSAIPALESDAYCSYGERKEE